MSSLISDYIRQIAEFTRPDTTKSWTSEQRQSISYINWKKFGFLIDINICYPIFPFFLIALIIHNAIRFAVLWNTSCGYQNPVSLWGATVCTADHENCTGYGIHWSYQTFAIMQHSKIVINALLTSMLQASLFIAITHVTVNVEAEITRRWPLAKSFLYFMNVFIWSINEVSTEGGNIFIQRKIY